MSKAREAFLSLMAHFASQSENQQTKNQIKEDAARPNSICHQEHRVRLRKSEISQIHAAASHLHKARSELCSALAALEGFNEIQKRELLLAASFSDGYLYMLGQYLNQNKQGLNDSMFDQGLGVIQ